MAKSKAGKGPGKQRARRVRGGGVQGRKASAQHAGSLWLYGTHAVQAALANPRRQFHRLLATDSAAAELQAAGLEVGSSLEQVFREELANHLPDGAVHQGVAALVAPLPTTHLNHLLQREPHSSEVSATSGSATSGSAAPDSAAPDSAAPDSGKRQVLVVLDQITDPQNCGAILRSAAAFGAIGVVAPSHHAAPESGALAKAASGALELVPRVEVGNLSQALRQMQAAGYWVLGLAEEGPIALTADAQNDFGPRVALVLGAEGRGLRRLTRETCDALVRLPTRPALPSLNVSNAAAVALYALQSS